MTVCSLVQEGKSVFFGLPNLFVIAFFEQEPVELLRMYGDSSAGTEAKSEHAKVCIKEQEEHS